jgi:outer membrane protein assembly factor BamB
MYSARFASRRKGFALCLIVSMAIGLSIGSVVSAEDWGQFRGPNCSGISNSKASLPTRFSATNNVRWSQDLGDGIGSPVVAAGRVFVSAMADEKTVGLYAFDVKTGKNIWARTD